VRVFLALPLPEAAAAGLAAAIEPLRRGHPRLRWVPPSGYHLTLHFFGELDDRAVTALKAVLAQPELRIAPIPARFGSLGQFPAQGAPRVIHAVLEKGATEALAFHDKFHALVAPLGYAPEARGFTPHVTLARAGAERIEPGWESGVEVPRRDFLIGQCILYQSILGAGGARYAPLASVAFCPPAGREAAP
jgi:2'-5' RNA ligase